MFSVLFTASCFGETTETGLAFRLSNSSSVKDAEIKTLRVRLYRAGDVRPLSEIADPAKACKFAGQDLAPDPPFHETELDYGSRSGLLYLTFAGEKLSLVVDAFKITKAKERILGARGLKTDIEVQLGQRSDAGEIELFDPLEESRPGKVKIAGRSGRITTSWEAVQGATDYLVCIADSTGAFQPILVTGTSTEIKELPADNLGKAPKIDDGTTYRLMVFAHNAGGISLAGESPAEAQDPAIAGTKFAAETFMATPQKKVPKADEPQLVVEQSEYRVKLSWEGVSDATAYCLDSNCIEPGAAKCIENPKLAHAFLPDTNEKSEVRCETPKTDAQRCLKLRLYGSDSTCTYELYAVNEGNGISDPVTMTLTIRK